MGTHLDPQLEDRILHEVKSQGVFDEFRKDSMADVDTKPAYQNLRQRVEGTVKKFLSEQRWTPDMNKNQLREKLRRHITESGFLDVGVERIVDQVVNPKIGTVFQPRIEEITYKYLGLPPPPVKHEPPPPIMHPLPPLPLSGPPPLRIETSSLLPTGLEQVSPDSDKATVKSECREDDKSVLDMDVDGDEKLTEDDDESPPFEPLVKRVEESKPIKTGLMEKRAEEVDVKLEMSPPKNESMPKEKLSKVESGYQKEIRYAETHDTSGSANSTNITTPKNSTSYEADVAISQDSQLSQVSSDSRLSDVTANASHSFMDNSSTHNPAQTHSDQTEAVIELASANISEEAQMPKFNENSCEMAGAITRAAELHFDIKKDEIKFEGTERKSSLLEKDGECNSKNVRDISPRQANTAGGDLENKNPPHHFGNLTINMNVEPNNPTTDPSTPAATPTPTPHDSSFGSSLEDTSFQQYAEQFEGGLKNDSTALVEVALSAPLHALSDMKEVSSSQNRGSSSSRHKKHSKDKRRSHDSKEKYKDSDRSKNKDSSRDKYKGNDRDRSSGKSKHRYKERSKDKDRERKEKGRGKDKEGYRSHDKHSKGKNDEMDRSSSSKRSSSSTGRSRDTSSCRKEKSGTSKHTSTFMSSSSSSSRSESHEARRDRREYDKKQHRSSSKNESSSKKDDRKSETAKTEVVVDDHSSEKVKVRRHKSTDSNDEDKGGGTGAGGHNGESVREDGSLHFSGTNSDKQKDQHKDSKNTSPSSQSRKGKSKGGLEECGYGAKRVEDSNMIAEATGTACTNELVAQQHRNKVVILNDMLENPNINFIDLGPTMTTYSITADVAVVDITPHKIDDASPKVNITPNKVDDTTSKINIAPTKKNITLPKAKITPPDDDNTPTVTNTVSTTSTEMEKEEQLLFFEEINVQFSERLRLLDHAMDRCRRVVNNLRFDCGNELCETFETLEEPQNNSETDANITTQTCATLTIDCVPAYAVGDCFSSNEKSVVSPVENASDRVFEFHGTRKRNNNGQPIQSKPSPTPSDASVNSKENMALDKNADVAKFVRRNASVNKLSQQRYNSEDLYKPRPVLSQRSRRRGMDAII